MYQGRILYLQKELKNKDNMMQSLLTQLSKQTDFIKNRTVSCKEVLVNRNNTQSQNNNQADINVVLKKDKSSQQIAVSDELISRLESVI